MYRFAISLFIVMFAGPVSGELIAWNFPDDTFEMFYSTVEAGPGFETPTAAASKFSLASDSTVSQIVFFGIERTGSGSLSQDITFSVRIFGDVEGMPGEIVFDDNAVFTDVSQSNLDRGGIYTGRRMGEGSYWTRWESQWSYDIADSLRLPGGEDYWLSVQQQPSVDYRYQYRPAFCWEVASSGMGGAKSSIDPDFDSGWEPTDNTGFAFQIYGEPGTQLLGDANLDGDVDAWQYDGTGDAQILSGNLGMTIGALWTGGDFNGDGDVDAWQFDGFGDAQLLSANLSMGTSMGTVAVPEPSTLVFLMTLALPLTMVLAGRRLRQT